MATPNCSDPHAAPKFLLVLQRSDVAGQPFYFPIAVATGFKPATPALFLGGEGALGVNLVAPRFGLCQGPLGRCAKGWARGRFWGFWVAHHLFRLRRSHDACME